MASASGRPTQRQTANACAVRQIEVARNDPANANTQEPAPWSPFQNFAASLNADIRTVQAALHCQHGAVKFHLPQPTFQTQSLPCGQFRAEISAGPNQ